MTAYRIARNPGDFAAAQELARKEGFVKVKMTLPTILAFDGNDLVGVLATRIQDNMIVAGPMALKSDRRRPRTALRLAELYDIAMKGMGVTSYIFNTEAGGVMDQIVQKLGVAEQYASTGAENYYIRRL